MKAKPLPYCTPQMLAMLNRIALGHQPLTNLPRDEGTAAMLISRGWMYADKITIAGRTYLASLKR